MKAFAENLFAQTRERSQKKASATIKRHETKYKLRVCVPGEIVLVDVGKKTKVSKKRDMVKAIVVEALTNNYYTIEFASGSKSGEQADINGDLVEPLQKKSQVMNDTIPVRQERTKKGPKPRNGTKKAVVALLKPKSTSNLPDAEIKRSESHWFKQTNQLLTMDRNKRKAQAKIYTKHQEASSRGSATSKSAYQKLIREIYIMHSLYNCTHNINKAEILIFKFKYGRSWLRVASKCAEVNTQAN